MANLIQQFETLKNSGCRFTYLGEYLTQNNEKANYTVNVGISVENARKGDLEALKNCPLAILVGLSERSNIPLETFKTAINEMIISGQKNTSDNMADHTPQSRAQSEAYINFAPGLRINKNTLEIHIFGQVVKKDPIKSDESDEQKKPDEQKKKVNSSPKTIAKQMITSSLDLRSGKFRTFILNNVSTVKINGDCFVIV